MKKTSVIIIAVLICVSMLFVGCSKSAKEADYSPSYPQNGGSYADSAEHSLNMDVISTFAPTDSKSDGSDVLSGRMVIRNAELAVETKEFDAFINSITDKLISLGGYIQSNRVNERGYRYGNLRYADMVLRIPADKLDIFLREVDGIGNVIERYENVDDVTEQYVDIEARLSAVRTEYDTLLELLSRAESLEDIITLQDRLSSVRYQIESYEGKLRNYDSLISYSTVSMNVYEVERETSVEKETFGQEASRKFKESLQDVGDGMRTFAIWFIGNLPTILIWAVIIAVIVLIVLRITLGGRKKRKARKEIKTASAENEK
ncbi:MAG: DUF4349 domain-containing protein [Clostridia bacterium]|nr:DUF4349 domain-containing protein [Clostridia bacterium]